MIRGINASRYGMQWEQNRTEVIADNVANINTAGFKRSIAAGTEFGEILLRRLSSSGDPVAPAIGRLGQGAQLAQVAVDSSQGALEQTDRPLDVALVGPGEFVFMGPGGPGYTRQGSFQRDASGTLVTGEGHPVLVNGAAVGAGAGEFSVLEDGTVLVDGVAVGRFDLRGGEATRFVSGALERPNVDMAHELTNLITSLRGFQANQRALQAQDETLAKAVTEIGRV